VIPVAFVKDRGASLLTGVCVCECVTAVLCSSHRFMMMYCWLNGENCLFETNLSTFIHWNPPKAMQEHEKHHTLNQHDVIHQCVCV